MGELDSIKSKESPLKKHVAQFHEDAGSVSKKKKEKANRSSASVCDLIHDWKQESNTVTVVIQIGPSIDNRSIEINVEEQHLSVVLLDGRKMQMNLFARIVPDSKTVVFWASRCVITLHKQDPDIDWLSLEMPERPMHKSKSKLDIGIARGEVLKAQKEHLENEKDQTEFVPVVKPKTDMVEREGSPSIMAYLYVKGINRQTLVVEYEEESFRVLFSTSDLKFLGQYENASKDTVFEWPVTVKGKLKKTECTYKLTATKLEIIMMKDNIVTWGALSPTTENKGIIEDPNKGTWLNVPSGGTSNSIIPPAPPAPPTFNGGTKSPSWMTNNTTRNNTQPSTSKMACPPSENWVSPLPRGVTGLENLGNTCFMNSVLQCLINTNELRGYFLGNYYQEDINKENPLGMGGLLAEAFGSLMKLVWSGEHRSTAPSDLKRVMSIKANQFSGYAQHDSQEFMVELLDGLHEDLNRIKKKPYIAEPPDLEGWSDSDAAEESWRLNKSRNDSVIDDLFKGQFKSTLQCHTCKKVSLKFDEFCCLSVPIPKDLKIIAVIFYWRDTSRKPRRIVSQVSADAIADELLQQLSKKTGVLAECIKIIESGDSKINKRLEPHSVLSTVSASDKFMAFEVLSASKSDEQILELAVTQRKISPSPPTVCSSCSRNAGSSKLRTCKNCYRVGYCNTKCQNNHLAMHRARCKMVPECVGSPFIISLRESEATYTNLSRLMEGYARFSVDIFQPPVTQSKKHRGSGSDGEMSSETEDMEVDSEDELDSWPSKQKAGSYYGGDRAEGDWGAVVRHCGSLNSSSTSSGEEEAPQLSSRMSPVPIRMSPVPHRAVNCAKTLFAIRPSISRGAAGGDPLIDQGSNLLDLSDYLYLCMDWNTNESMPVHCFVQNKEMDCEASREEECFTGNKKTSIEACIDLFTRPENLSEDDSWKCPRCKKPVEATKQMSLSRLPTVLIIQLKRFSFKYVLYSDKIDKFVNYPIRGLDLRPFMSDHSQDLNATYDLYGVINHMGRLLGGHYTAFSRTVDSQNTCQSEIDWRLCDDSRVQKLDESRVVHDRAYLLLYRRRDCPFVIDRPVSVTMDDNATDSDEDLREPGGCDNDGESFINNLRNATTSIGGPQDRSASFSDDLD